MSICPLYYAVIIITTTSCLCKCSATEHSNSRSSVSECCSHWQPHCSRYKNISMAPANSTHRHKIIQQICKTDVFKNWQVASNILHHIKANNKLSCCKETMRLRHGSVLAKYNWEMILCRHYKAIFNHCDVIGLKICRIRLNSPFKVIQGTNQKPVRDFLSVINTNGHTFSYGFEDIANYLLFIILCNFTKTDPIHALPCIF